MPSQETGVPSPRTVADAVESGSGIATVSPPVPRRRADWGDESFAVRLRGLQEMSAALAEAQSVDDVARVVVRAVAALPGVVRGGFALNAAGGRELRFLAVVDDDTVGATPLSWCVLDATDDLPLAATAHTGVGLWFPTLAELRERFPAMAAHQAKFGVRGFATVPLAVGEERIGALMLGYGEPRSFGAAERAFLEALAGQAAHAVRRAQSFEHQKSTAETLQRALLPDLLPELPGLSMAAQYVPGAADVGGDWFDVVPLDDGSVLVVIGDVMGRGVAAATVMGQVRAALRAYALLDPDPVLVLTRLDRLVTSLGVPEQIVTVLAGVVAPDRDRVRLASAGHLPPVLAAPVEAARLVDVPADPPLGLAVGKRQGLTVSLPAGATLVLATDGLVESPARPAEDGLLELCALLDSVEGAGRLPQDLCAWLSVELGAPGSVDDVAVLVVSSTVGRVRRADQVSVPAELQAPAMARRWLRELLRLWSVSEDVADDAALCLTEVVTNAVIHAGTGARVAAELDEHRLLISVVDTGRRGAAQRRDTDVEEIRGRGLAVVNTLASAWSTERRSDGTLVWFEFDVT